MLLKTPVVICALLLQGCALPYPHLRQMSPDVAGVVRAEDTQRPIIDATVTLVSGSDKASTLTDTDGRYHVVATESAFWWRMAGGPTEGSCEGTVSIKHPDYEPVELKIQEARAATAEGVCDGYLIERNVSLRRKQP